MLVPEPIDTANEGFSIESTWAHKIFAKNCDFWFFLVNFVAAILDSIVNIILYYLKLLEKKIKM